MIIGDRLRELREEKNLSQGDIEKRTGLLRCYISRVENGHTVPAIETLDELERAGAGGSFDVAFIDANKEDYDRYYEAALRLTRIGGLIILDNMLWLGRVADPEDHDPRAVTIRDLNAKIARDERVDRVILPIADGVTFVSRR